MFMLRSVENFIKLIISLLQHLLSVGGLIVNLVKLFFYTSNKACRTINGRGVASFFCLVILLGSSTSIQAQNFDVEIGPVYGHYTDSSRNFWMLVRPHLEDYPGNDWISTFNADLFAYFNQNTPYNLDRVERTSMIKDRYVLIRGCLDVRVPQKAPQDLSFLVGSCAFPYPFVFWSGKRKEVIFNSMTRQEKDFMIWMGDNVYYLFGNWKQPKKMHQVHLKMRTKPALQALLESCPHYAIWDDHDFGANNSDSSYSGRFESLEMFKNYWPNPYYGLDTAPGVFCHFSHADADFFMLDARFYASAKSMLGQAQTNWLKAQLKASKANFKFVISGTQILPDNPSGEDLGDFGTARQELLDFLEKEQITGIIFLSGDRHYGELLKLERPNQYPLYEMTSSPMTSVVNPAYTRDNPIRENETLVLDLNFGKVQLLGDADNRRCRLALFDRLGQRFWQRDILLSDLR